jgi:two-component system nitrogen regulation sensor histidine kinase NtrY
MRTSRFERRILAAILIVVIGSLLGALGFGYVAVHDAFRMGVNGSVRSALDEGVSARRAHLVALRELTERTADWLANDMRIHEAIAASDSRAAESVVAQAIATHPSIGRVTIFVGDSEQPFAERTREVGGGAAMRPLSRTRPIAGAREPSEVEVVLYEPESTFASFARAGETAELVRRLEARRTYVSNAYVGVYTGFVLSISFAALLLGVVLSRRVTRNIGSLAAATREVGRGDLAVEVPVRSDDEIGELTRSFNTMVRDLRASRVRIEALQRIGAWQDFARRLAHEIKNPLTPIQLAGQELASSYRGDDPAYRKKLDEARSIIEEEVATLRRLVTEFSNFARLPRVELAPADLGEVARDFERSLPGLVEDSCPDPAKRPRVDVHIVSGAIPVRLDAMMFRRALDNLVRNAVQAVRDREGGGHVSVTIERVGSDGVLEISDDGPGIPEADRERIFDPYYTTKHDGTGLGLPIVMKVVLEHGGRIELEPSPAGGACFRVVIPLSRDQE